MKALFLLFATVAAFSLSAQPQGHFNKHHNATSNPSPKDNYSWKMTSFQTDDNYQLCQFSYDINHRLIAYTDTVRGEYYVVDSMTYDDNGNMVRLSGWQRLNGTLQNVYYIDYTYNEAELIASRSNYNNFNGVWELGGVYNYSYDENGKIVLTTLTMGNMVYQKIEYAYDGDKCLSELWYSYSFDAGALLPSEKYVNTYSNGHLTLQYDSVSDDGVHWSNNGRYTYVYDNMGNCLEHHHYDKYGSEVERNVYTYNNDMPLSSTLLPWNPEINRPKVYDNVSVCTREAWYSLDIDQSEIDEAIEKSNEAINTANSALAAVTTGRSVWFNNVAEMIATDIEAGVTAETKGYYVANDGGNALYLIRQEKSAVLFQDVTLYV